MTETPRDRLWVAALALARTRGSFDASDVLAGADLSTEYGSAAREVLSVMREYGFLDRESGRWFAGRSAPRSDASPSGFDGTFTYLSAPNERWTFAPETVREWVESRLAGRVLNLFAGGTTLDHDGEVVRNDVDGAIPADTRVDAREIADAFAPSSFDTVVLDPPAAMRAGADGDLARVKAGAVELLRGGGLAITVGRNSHGMGSARGFETIELCLIAHPGGADDTIAVVERLACDPTRRTLSG